MYPWQWLLICVLVPYAGLKAAALATAPRRPDRLGTVLYLTIWPGFDLRPLCARHPADPARGDATGRLAARGGAVVVTGLAAWSALVLFGGRLDRGPLGWLGVAVVLATVHLGCSDLLVAGMRTLGYPVRRLFADPLLSRSLREFWSRRWNLAFVELNQAVFLPLLARPFGRSAILAAFALSGILHELAVSVPVGRGFGLPLAYFALHGLLTHTETRLRLRRWPAPLARLWTWGWLLVPLPLLFHHAFRDALVVPLFRWGPS